MYAFPGLIQVCGGQGECVITGRRDNSTGIIVSSATCDCGPDYDGYNLKYPNRPDKTSII